MKPESLNVLLDVFDNVAANFGQNFLLRQIESMELDFEGFDVFAEGDDTSEVGEKVGEDFGFVEMAITETLNFDVSDVGHACFLNIIGELLEFDGASEEISVTDVEFVDLGGIKDHFEAS
jgi:hypothetical protein